MATSQAVEQRQCPECEQPGEPDGTEVVCPTCGLVIDTDPVEHGEKEWRAYSYVEAIKRERTGPLTNRAMPDRGLGSSIGYRGQRVVGGDVSSRQEMFHKQAQTGSKRDKNRGYATTEIHRMASALEMPGHVRDGAKRLFRQYHDDVGAVGKDLDLISAACLYHVARVHGLGRSPGDIASVARAEERPIIRQHRRLCNELGIGAPPPDPAQRVRVVGADLDVDQDVVERALEIIDAADESVVGSGSPSTLAAGALYLAADGDVTQVEVCDVAGCTDVSLRTRAAALEGRSDG